MVGLGLGGLRVGTGSKCVTDAYRRCCLRFWSSALPYGGDSGSPRLDSGLQTSADPVREGTHKPGALGAQASKPSNTAVV